MKIALMTSQVARAGFFIQRLGDRLKGEGIEVGCVVVDDNQTKRACLAGHVLSVAKRQAKVAGSSLSGALLRLVAFRLLSSAGRRYENRAVAGLPNAIPSVRVSSLNSAEAVNAVRAHDCDATCLLGGRILTKSTIQELGHVLLNGHASDPRFVRGRPPVFWEALDGHRHICLTVHQVVPRLDAGPIYGQRLQEILYCGGIGATIDATMRQARVRMTDLLAEVLIGMRAGTIVPMEFRPGPVRTLPRVSQLIRAEIVCRRRSRRMNRHSSPLPALHPLHRLRPYTDGERVAEGRVRGIQGHSPVTLKMPDSGGPGCASPSSTQPEFEGLV